MITRSCGGSGRSTRTPWFERNRRTVDWPRLDAGRHLRSNARACACCPQPPKRQSSAVPFVSSPGPRACDRYHALPCALRFADCPCSRDPCCWGCLLTLSIPLVVHGRNCRSSSSGTSLGPAGSHVLSLRLCQPTRVAPYQFATMLDVKLNGAPATGALPFGAKSRAGTRLPPWACGPSAAPPAYARHPRRRRR
jgi:hypothetical protein